MTDTPREEPEQTSLTDKNNETLAEMKARHLSEIRERVEGALKENDWSQAQTARELGCSTSTLGNILKRFPELWEEASSRTWPGRYDRKKKPKKK